MSMSTGVTVAASITPRLNEEGLPIYDMEEEERSFPRPIKVEEGKPAVAHTVPFTPRTNNVVRHVTFVVGDKMLSSVQLPHPIPAAPKRAPRPIKPCIVNTVVPRVLFKPTNKNKAKASLKWMSAGLVTKHRRSKM